MSRNMIEANTAIFKKLCEKEKDSDLYNEKDYGNKKRWIKTTKKEKQYLQHTVIKERFHLSHHIVCSLLEFKTERYFVISGVQTEDNMYLSGEFGAVSEDIFVGLGVVILSELLIPLNDQYSSNELIENILPNYKGVDDYKGHSFNEIKDCFIAFKIFSITNPERSLYQLAGLVLCKQIKHLLKFSDDTLDKFEDIFLSGNSALPFDSLVYALYSVSWKHTFLELYRCIENLYPIFAIREIYDSLRTLMCKEEKAISIIDFYNKLNSLTRYREKEEESLEKIIKFISPSNEIFSVAQKNNSPQSDSSFLYDLRCSIVHLSISKTKINFTFEDDVQWDGIIVKMLEIINKIYEEHKNLLPE